MFFKKMRFFSRPRHFTEPVTWKASVYSLDLHCKLIFMLPGDLPSLFVIVSVAQEIYWRIVYSYSLKPNIHVRLQYYEKFFKLTYIVFYRVSRSSEDIHLNQCVSAGIARLILHVSSTPKVLQSITIIYNPRNLHTVHIYS